MSLHTDTIINQTFKDDVLTIFWKKGGNFKYTKINDHWYEYGTDRAVGPTTNTVLNDQFKKA
jgi:hypothetical protein